MFRAKSSEPPPQFAVQILTVDYLIEGHISTNMPWHSPVVVDVNAARYQPSGNLTLPAGSAPLLHVQQHAINAIIPKDELCAKDIVKGFSTGHPLAVTILIDHYRFRGTAFSSSNSLHTLTFTEAFLMQDVHIDNLTAGAQLQELTAPYALIYTRKTIQAIFANG